MVADDKGAGDGVTDFSAVGEGLVDVTDTNTSLEGGEDILNSVHWIRLYVDALVPEYVSEPIVDIQGVRIGPTFDPLFLEIGVPLVPFQESRGVPAKEVLRESAQSPKPFDAHTLRSKLSSYDLKLLREHCEISPIIKLRLPDENESANMTPIDEIGVYWDMFINGFRVPLHPFFIKVFNAYGLAPGQFSPHAWRFMSFFIYQCHKLGLNPRVRVFRWFFTICSITKQVGWYFLSRRPKAEANLFPHPPSSNHHWKERFLFVKLPKSQMSEVCNVWLAECETRACNKLKETDLSETDLEHIGKLKEVEPLESRYPLNNAQLCECGIIFPPEPQDFVDEEDEEEEGKNNPGKALIKPWVCLIVNGNLTFIFHAANMSSRAQGDPPLFNALGVLGDIIPDELASIHGLEEEEMQDLDFGALVSGSQPKPTETQTENFVLGLTSVDKSKETSKKRKVSSRAGSRATSSSIRLDTPHRPAWGVSVDESVFKSPRTAWDWSSHAIIPMDRKTLYGYGVTETANGMVQIGAEKLIAADKVLDEEKKKVMIENNFCREVEKKVEDLSKKVERLELSNAGMTAKNAELSAHRLRDSKGALVDGYNECKTDVSKDHPELDMSIYEHKFAREVASETKRRAKEAKRKKAASFRALTSPSMSRNLGASGSASMAIQGRNCLWLKATLKRWRLSHLHERFEDALIDHKTWRLDVDKLQGTSLLVRAAHQGDRDLPEGLLHSGLCHML
ncbi:hypothetical protein RJ639_017331 [Escallonia herrerae]|uniref:Transposase (putative) gypsy type domain-containing protein n=1 Tax=Escallonia herrerae TaxID=1293975 RepID=A0AA89ANQ0_9ASTE|nr:hypothetical protein RJ639_017331 [Escallonia herrerae]